VKSIGEIGGTNAVNAHFIEWPENLQGTAECAMGDLLGPMKKEIVEAP
jgi:hypothetical protein